MEVEFLQDKENRLQNKILDYFYGCLIRFFLTFMFLPPRNISIWWMHAHIIDDIKCIYMYWLVLNWYQVVNN